MRKTEPTPEPVSHVLAQIASEADVAELKTERVVSVFERQILSGRLEAGARLPNEGELCRILGVSRSVIRDSIRTLSTRGLVLARQGSGTVITEPGDRAFTTSLLILLSRSGLTMRDVVQARATIEGAVVPLAATSGTEQDWMALESALNAFQEAVDAGDNQAATLAHTRFHIGLLDAAHQLALSLMLNPMTEITTLTSSASIRRRMPEDWEVESHRPILKALESRNTQAAVRGVTAHYADYDPARPSSPYREFLARRFSDAYFDVAGRTSRLGIGRGRAPESARKFVRRARRDVVHVPPPGSEDHRERGRRRRPTTD